MEETNLSREKNSQLSHQFMVWFGSTPCLVLPVGVTGTMRQLLEFLILLLTYQAKSRT